MILAALMTMSAYANDNDIQWQFEYALDLYNLHTRHPVCQAPSNKLLEDDAFMGKLANMLMARDQAAWHTTDAIVASDALDGVKGYITDVVDDKMVIHYVAETDDGLMSRFYAVMEDRKTPTWPDAARAPATVDNTTSPTPLPKHLHDDWACRQATLAAYHSKKLTYITQIRTPSSCRLARTYGPS